MCLSLGMIKGNELRIGNTVLSCGEIYNIECGEDIDQLSFEPISLNDEWLNKIGFEYDKYTNCVNYGLFYIRKDEDGFEINFYDNEYTLGEFSFHVQYVHQLENAYFSIHQEELTIK